MKNARKSEDFSLIRLVFWHSLIIMNSESYKVEEIDRDSTKVTFIFGGRFPCQSFKNL